MSQELLEARKLWEEAHGKLLIARKKYVKAEEELKLCALRERFAYDDYFEHPHYDPLHRYSATESIALTEAKKE